MAAQSRTYLLVVGDSGPQQWYYCDLEHIRNTKWGKKICYERRIGINFHNYLHPLFHQLWRCWYLQMCKRDPLLSAIPKTKSDTNRVFQWQEQPGNHGILCIVGQSLILLGYNKCVLDFFTFFFFFLSFIGAGKSSQWNVNHWQNFQVLVWICKQCLYQHCQLWDPGPSRSWCENQGSDDWCMFSHCKYEKSRGSFMELDSLREQRDPCCQLWSYKGIHAVKSQTTAWRIAVHWKAFIFYFLFFIPFLVFLFL